MNELGVVVVIDSIYWMCGTLPKRKKENVWYLGGGWGGDGLKS
jgi:hypothetical protein